MDCTIQNAPIPRNVQRNSKDKRTADFMYHPEDNLEWVEWEEESEDRPFTTCLSKSEFLFILLNHETLG